MASPSMITAHIHSKTPDQMHWTNDLDRSDRQSSAPIHSPRKLRAVISISKIKTANRIHSVPNPSIQPPNRRPTIDPSIDSPIVNDPVSVSRIKLSARAPRLNSRDRETNHYNDNVKQPSDVRPLSINDASFVQVTYVYLHTQGEQSLLSDLPVQQVMNNRNNQMHSVNEQHQSARNTPKGRIIRSPSVRQRRTIVEEQLPKIDTIDCSTSLAATKSDGIGETHSTPTSTVRVERISNGNKQATATLVSKVSEEPQTYGS